MLNILRHLVLLSTTLSDSFNLFNSSLKYIADNYFINESVLFVHWSNSSIELNERYIKNFNDIGILTLELCDLWGVKTRYGEETERSHVENTIVLWNDEIVDEQQIRMMKNCESLNPESKIILLVNKKTGKAIRDLLKEFWILTKAINVTIMTIVGISVKFYTLQPYKHFIMEELQIENLFPNKIPKNFNGSIIYATTSTSQPFVMSGHKDGVEIRMMNEIAKHLNFRIEYKYLPRGENVWFSRRIRGRMTGSFGLLGRLEVDLFYFGYPLKDDKYQIADIVAIHTIDKLIWILPKFPNIFDWKNLFEIFQLEIWLLMLMFSFLISLIVFILTKPGQNSFTYFDAFFQVLAQYLNSPIYYYLNGYLYRIFMIIFSFYNLILISSYQSSLVAFLTTPETGKEYESLEEVADDGLIAVLFPGVANNLSDHNFWNKVLQPGHHLFTFDLGGTLETIHVNKTMFTRGSAINLRYRSNERFLLYGEHFNFQVMDKVSDIYYVPVYASKGHPLRELLGRNIMKFVESGLARFWAEELVMDQSSEHKNDEPFPLSINHLQGIFFVCSGMIILAIFVFVCENFYGRRKKFLRSLCRKSFCSKRIGSKRKSYYKHVQARIEAEKLNGDLPGGQCPFVGEIS